MGRSGVGRINLKKEDPFSKQARKRMGTYTRMELSSVKMKKFPSDGTIFSIKQKSYAEIEGQISTAHLGEWV